MFAGALVSGCLMALTVLIGVGTMGGSDMIGGALSNSSPSYTPQYYPSSGNTQYYNGYYPRKELVKWGNEFERLLKNFNLDGNHIPGTSKSIDISSLSITQQDWNNFCKLKDKNEEFNIYSGELLYSQAENYFEMLKKYLAIQLNNSVNPKCTETCAFLNTICPTGLIAEYLKLQPQYNRLILNKWYNLPEVYKIFESQAPNRANKLKQVIKACTNEDILLKNNISNFDDYDRQCIKMIQNTVKGSLAFWNWKQKRKYVDRTLAMPIMLDNGDNRCWLQTGFYMLYSLTASDDLDKLTNWGKFIKHLKHRQLMEISNQVKKVKSKYPGFCCVSDNELGAFLYQKAPRLLRINLTTELKDFCNNNYDYSKYNNRNTVNKELNFLLSDDSNKGNSPQKAIEIFKKMFPELNDEKFNTGEGLYEVHPIDPVLKIRYSDCKTSQQKYALADTAIRHFIPVSTNENDGIGRDPVGVSCPNQYGEYKLKMSLDGKLQVYELRGIALSEHLPEFKKVPINKTFDDREKYSILPALHSRSVIKIDSSPNWYYCDSNGIYFGANSLQSLFRDKRSIMNYDQYATKHPLPENHAACLMYHLIDEQLWNGQLA